ncbi:Sir2 family NAD-dependent protein deacetylase [Lactobacillus corticis]|uniref:Deacetylase sirtuin-type domain-containing protein n=1 Tax=Lactobacillus corticis TaxID=2201249 RepID=A0A916VHL8_9LACO|nr:Sir2 family NAD-dependent protein deacetylase [Lactobacillus corticis]GFZ26777.1 hypothetical protein LCB40_06570 [Lactobacillus corticis]
MNLPNKLWHDADKIVLACGNQFLPLDDFAELEKAQQLAWPERWAKWSELIGQKTLNFQEPAAFSDVRKLLAGKEYFIATSSFEHYFEAAGFNEQRIFNLNGDWTVMQCSSGINHGQLSDLATVKAYLAGQGSVPKCAKCGREMELHVPLSQHFYPDTDANTRFRWFLTGAEDDQVLLVQLGVDETTPQLADPLVHLSRQFANWHLVKGDADWLHELVN